MADRYHSNATSVTSKTDRDMISVSKHMFFKSMNYETATHNSYMSFVPYRV